MCIILSDASTRKNKSHHNRNIHWIAYIQICLFKMDVEYPLCMCFSLVLTWTESFFKKVFLNWTSGGKGKQVNKWPRKISRMTISSYHELVKLCTNLSYVCRVSIILQYFWNIGGVPPLSFPNLFFCLYRPLRLSRPWVVSPGLSAVPRLWSNNCYV